MGRVVSLPYSDMRAYGPWPFPNKAAGPIADCPAAARTTPRFCFTSCCVDAAHRIAPAAGFVERHQRDGNVVAGNASFSGKTSATSLQQQCSWPRRRGYPWRQVPRDAFTTCTAVAGSISLFGFPQPCPVGCGAGVFRLHVGSPIEAQAHNFGVPAPGVRAIIRALGRGRPPHSRGTSFEKLDHGQIAFKAA
jgi:hypothetical protein